MRRKRFSGPPRSGGNPNNRPKGKPQHRPGGSGGYRTNTHSSTGGTNPNQDPYAAVPLRRAIQMRDKYLEMAKMTQDRTDTEYWLQHADHFNRIVMYHQQNVRYNPPQQHGDHHQQGDPQHHEGGDNQRHDRQDRGDRDTYRSHRGAPYPENPGDGENDGDNSNSNGSIDAEPFVMPTGPGIPYVPSPGYGLNTQDKNPPIVIAEDEE